MYMYFGNVILGNYDKNVKEFLLNMKKISLKFLGFYVPFGSAPYMFLRIISKSILSTSKFLYSFPISYINVKISI